LVINRIFAVQPALVPIFSFFPSGSDPKDLFNNRRCYSPRSDAIISSILLKTLVNAFE